MEEIIADMSEVSDKTVEVEQTEVARMEDPVSTEALTEDRPEAPSKSSKDFSPEERATIIAMAKEVGFAKVANEFGIKARLISYWIQQEKRKESKALKPLKALKRPVAKASAKGKDSKRTLVKEVAQPEHITDTPSVAAVPTGPAERKAERTVSAKPAGSAKLPERSEALTDRQSLIDRQTLIIENAILKERIASLNAEIEKLRAALTSLM